MYPFVRPSSITQDAVAALRVPDHPPYGGAFDEVVPHLTVADPGRLGVALTAPGDLVQGLERGLPVEAVADGVHLMIEGADARWSVLERFSLGWRA